MPPRLITVTYVSRSQIFDGDIDAEIASIVRTSTDHNADWNITGALLFSGSHFLQVLEGTHDQLAWLLSRLADDPRHSDLVVIARQEIAERRFPDWSMLYCGQAGFAASFFSRLHAGKPAATDLAIVYAMAERMAA